MIVSIDKFSQADIKYNQRAKAEKPIIWLALVAFTIFFFTFNASEISIKSFIVLGLLGIQYFLISINRKLTFNQAILYPIAISYFYLFWYKEGIIDDLKQNLLVLVGEGITVLILLQLFSPRSRGINMHILLFCCMLVFFCATQVWLPWFVALAAVFITLACYCKFVISLNAGLENNDSFVDNPRNKHESVFQQNQTNQAKMPRKRFAVVAGMTGLLIFCAGSAAFMFTPRIKKNQLPNNMANLLEKIPININLRNANLAISKNYEIFMKVRAFKLKDNSPINIMNTPQAYIRSEVLDTYLESSFWTKEFKSNIVPANRLKIKQRRLIDKNKDKLIYFQIQSLYNSHNKVYTPFKTLYIAGDWKYSVDRNDDFEYALSASDKYSRELSRGVLISYESLVLPSPQTPATRHIFNDYFKPFNLLPAFRNSRARYNKPPLADIQMNRKNRARITKLIYSWAGELIKKRDQIARLRNYQMPASTRHKKLSNLNYKIAERIQNKLRENYTYTFEPSKLESSRDGIVDFLFYSKTGHCQYFASAMTAMCTYAKIPARVVLGFHLSEYNAKDKCFIGRGRDAHAWVEVFTNQKGWTVFEPTSPIMREKERNSDQMSAWLKKKLANMNFDWNSTNIKIGNGLLSRRIGHFSRNSLSGLRRMLRNIDLDMDMGGGIRRPDRKKTSKSFDQQFWENIAWYISGALILGILIYLHIKYGIHNLLANLFMSKDKRRLAHQIFLIEKLFTLLKKYKFHRDPAKTLAELLHKAKVDFRLPEDQIEFFIDLEYKTRWGKIPVSEQELTTAEAYYENICQRILESVKLQKMIQKGKIKPVAE